MTPIWRKWLMIGGVLLATHLASAAFYYARYASGAVQEGPAGTLTLDLTPDEWIRRSCVRDPAANLRVAENVAAGKGMTIRVPNSNPPRDVPFCYWAPGAPLVYGEWLARFGGRTMLTLFCFAVVCQLLFGMVTVATAALWTRSTAALALTAFFTGCCPPLQNWFYSSNLTSSELVGLLPLSAMMFALSKAFIAYRAAESTSWRDPRSRQAVAWFAAAGLLIGLHSLIRDSGNIFALFVAAFLLGRAAIADRKRTAFAGVAGLFVMAGAAAMRFPVERWNQGRIGQPIVSSSGAVAIWRYSLWVPPDRKGIHDFVASCAEGLPREAIDWFEEDLYRWCVVAGFGFGHDLDPRAAVSVEEYYQAERPFSALYSLGQFMQAVATHPAQAVAFKAKRLPVLWLGTDPSRETLLGLTPLWCLAAYSLLGAYVIVQHRRRRWIPEPVYLYALLIACAAPLIHFEFRYSFPIWNGLVLVPGLLLSTLRDQDRRSLGSGDAAALSHIALSDQVQATRAAA
jgi:hypothetical protein